MKTNGSASSDEGKKGNWGRNPKKYAHYEKKGTSAKSKLESNAFSKPKDKSTSQLKKGLLNANELPLN